MHIATESKHWRSLGKTCTLLNFFYGSGPFFLPTSQVLADSHQVRLAAASIKTAMEPPSVWRKARCRNAAACERTAWMGAPPALPVPGPWLPRNTTNYSSACSSFWTSWEQKDSTSAELGLEMYKHINTARTTKAKIRAVPLSRPQPAREKRSKTLGPK